MGVIERNKCITAHEENSNNRLWSVSVKAGNISKYEEWKIESKKRNIKSKECVLQARNRQPRKKRFVILKIKEYINLETLNELKYEIH